MRRDSFIEGIDLDHYRDPLLAILREILARPDLTRRELTGLLKQHPKDGTGLFRRSDLIRAYRAFTQSGDLPPFDEGIIARIRLKPIRTTSGVTVVTVLTKPFPCPGECIFCPSDVRMPKSYLADEPGAARAAQNSFDPYLQTISRLHTYYAIGHPTDKIEVIILGGTWSFYPESYQLWFVRRIFDALNNFGADPEAAIAEAARLDAILCERSQLHPDRLAGPEQSETPVTVDGLRRERTYNQAVQAIYTEELKRANQTAAALASGAWARSVLDEYATWDELAAVQRANENSACRNVGLVVETRPDHISVAEVVRIRRLGGTKVQIGVQSLDDEVLRLNKRGHDVAATRRAFALLRGMGFKIHAHWMPNLYGSTPQKDAVDYQRLWDDPALRPDELKLYPCSLIESAELMQRYADGSWRPYTHDELLQLLAACFLNTPEYCRLTRVIRDIPSTDIVDGNKTTNFRQVVREELDRRGQRSPDIRGREIFRQTVDPAALHLDELWYESSVGQEVFLQFITAERAIAGFLRLALPESPPLLEDLRGAAIIREVHVYGQALGIGEAEAGRAQHAGLGTQLIERAVEIARARGYTTLAVISAVGTRAYYRGRGFADGELYQFRALA